MNEPSAWIARREELRLDNARLSAIVAMEHIVALHRARLLLGYHKSEDSPQKQVITDLMAKLCDAEVNAKLKEVYACLKELLGP